MKNFGLVRSIESFYVGFSDETTIPVLKLLKHGFRHCFVFFGDENYTFVLDPISNRLDLSFLPLGVGQMLKLFALNNIKIVYVPKRFEVNKVSSTGIFTCVEVVKRILGISKFSIITPYRLYSFLNNTNNFPENWEVYS